MNNLQVEPNDVPSEPEKEFFDKVGIESRQLKTEVMEQEMRRHKKLMEEDIAYRKVVLAEVDSELQSAASGPQMSSSG